MYAFGDECRVFFICVIRYRYDYNVMFCNMVCFSKVNLFTTCESGMLSSLSYDIFYF
jgi:hypothetical protein